jgi:hypothetical protein
MTSIGQADVPAVVPYPSSWINRFFDWVDRLPGPHGLFYGLLGLLLIGLGVGLKWADGVYPLGLPLLFHLVFYGSFALGLWGLDDATRSPREAVRVIGPALKLDADAGAQLLYRFRYIPPRVAFWGCLPLGVLMALLFAWICLEAPQSRLIQGSPLVVGFDLFMCLVWGLYLSLFLYATYHLQGEIGRFYAHYVNVDLLLPQPLYGLSSASTRGALTTLLVVYLWVFTFPPGPTLIYYLVIGWVLAVGLVGTSILILPLRGMHRRLEAEKRQMQADLGRRIKATVAKLYEKADNGDYRDLDGLNKMLSSLELTRQTIDRAPTWPWHPDTPRLILTAILLPVILWLAQRLLGRLIQ